MKYIIAPTLLCLAVNCQSDFLGEPNKPDFLEERPNERVWEFPEDLLMNPPEPLMLNIASKSVTSEDYKDLDFCNEKG